MVKLLSDPLVVLKYAQTVHKNVLKLESFSKQIVSVSNYIK